MPALRSLLAVAFLTAACPATQAAQEAVAALRVQRVEIVDPLHR